MQCVLLEEFQRLVLKEISVVFDNLLLFIPVLFLLRFHHISNLIRRILYEPPKSFNKSERDLQQLTDNIILEQIIFFSSIFFLLAL